MGIRDNTPFGAWLTEKMVMPLPGGEHRRHRFVGESFVGKLMFNKLSLGYCVIVVGIGNKGLGLCGVKIQMQV